MVLFAKNAVTKSYLFGQRLANSAGAQPARNFSYLIKSLPRPENFRKLPHPDHVKGVSLWRNVFFLAGLPAVLLVNINISFFEDHFPKRADFHAYEYKHKRTKRFPWGDGNHSLFHNEYYNSLPDGYETADDWIEKHKHH